MPFPEHLEEIPLFEPYEKLSDPLGVGFPLYFQLKVFLMFFYVVLIAIVSVYAINVNKHAGKGSEWSDSEEETLQVITTTIGNHGKDASNYKANTVIVTLLLHNISILVILVLYVFFKQRQLNLIEKVDEGAITPADFTIVVENIAKNVDEHRLR